MATFDGVDEADRAAPACTGEPSQVAAPEAADVVAQRDRFSVRLRYVLGGDRAGMVAMGFIALVLLVTVVGPLVLGASAAQAHLQRRFVPPFHPSNGLAYILGSDALGRSLLARLVIATRTTLTISVTSVTLAALVGGVIGLVVGYLGGRVAVLAMRAADVMLAFPSLLLALIVLYTLGPGIPQLVLVLAASRFALYARVARAETLSIRERMFVTAARAVGAGAVRVVTRQIAPIVLASIVTLATVDFSLVILAESALSFLGLGVQQPNITWGGLVSDGQNYLRTAWWLALFPGMAITLTAMSVNILADALRRASTSD